MSKVEDAVDSARRMSPTSGGTRGTPPATVRTGWVRSGAESRPCATIVPGTIDPSSRT